jgi:hypothetical protein
MIGYWQRRKKAAHERSLQMNKARWDADRKRRDALAAANPVRFIGRILRRVVVIDCESAVREAVIYDFDSYREAKRKERMILR